MKLYATVTSERASKGQGGNKKLEIILTADNPERREEYKIWYQMDEKGTHLAVYDVQRGENILAKPKGKQQEMGICVSCDKDIPKGSSCDNCFPAKGKQQKGECIPGFWSKTCKGCKRCKREIDQD